MSLPWALFPCQSPSNGDGVGVMVGTGVSVEAGLGVRVAVAVAVGVDVLVAVGVSVGVGGGSAAPQADRHVARQAARADVRIRLRHFTGCAFLERGSMQPPSGRKPDATDLHERARNSLIVTRFCALRNAKR